MTSAEKLIEVRLAHRLVHDYQRRLLDLIGYAVGQLRVSEAELRFVGMLPVGFRGMGYSDPTAGRWAWDYLPLARFDASWATTAAPAPGSVCVGVEHYVDSGFPSSSRQDPEGASFPPAEQCQTTLVAWALAVPTGWPQDAALAWTDVLRSAGSAPRGERWFKGPATIDTGCRPVVAALALDVAVLDSREAVEGGLVEPWRDLVRGCAQAAGPTEAA